MHVEYIVLLSIYYICSQCRERSTSYCGRLQLQFEYRVNGELIGREDREVGVVPIMVKVSEIISGKGSIQVGMLL